VLRRLALRDFVIVSTLELDFDAGFSVLTGETGAGKSILVDALQLALGSRGDAGVVREGAPRADISAEFDTPATLAGWLDAAGIDAADGLLLRRSIDVQGKSRAWINGNPATATQLREVADHLLDIHGQHAWQSLTRPAAVRELLDGQAGVDGTAMAAEWARWKAAQAALEAARLRQGDLERERERLAWQIGEVDKLAPGAAEWEELNAEHQRLAHAQALLGAARTALDAVSDADESADALTGRAVAALDDVIRYDATLAPLVEVLHSAQAQLQDVAHTLSSYLNRTDLDPDRLDELDARLGTWVALARRYRRAPAELPVLLEQWQAELRSLDAATDLAALEAAVQAAEQAWRVEAKRISALRRKTAPRLAAAVTQAMQQLGMGGGRFEVALPAAETPQAHGLENVELLVAGHAGSTPRPLAKVASGGELSRLALAVAVTTCGDAGNVAQAPAGQAGASVGTLIFDEIDAGVGGAVADTVGRLMKQLGRDRQVLAVTHLAQVAACADQHFVVSKALRDGTTLTDVQAVAGEARVAEVARMLGGERLSTSVAHAQSMLAQAAGGAPAPADKTPPPRKGRSRA
jgi:DNA repair protein RecN (Recombination protein N)